MRKQFYLNELLYISLLGTILLSKPYKGGELRSEDSFQYGRFEVRMKSAPGSGVASSFFTYRDFWEEGLTSNSNWNEIDFEWLGMYEDKVHTNLIIQNGWDLPELVDLDVNTHDDFHVYAVEWTPNHVNFFIDDQLIRSVDNFYADSLYHGQKLMMNIWQPTYAGWAGTFDPSILPVYAFYDWVKYYAYVPNSGNAGTDNDFILLWTDNFDYYNASRWDKANHTWDGNNADLIYSNVVFESGYLILCLTNSTDTGYNGDPLNVEEATNLPTSILVGSAYPNPFNNEVKFPFSLNEPSNVQYSIFDLNGHMISNGQKTFQSPSTGYLSWNGLGPNGIHAPSGTYFVRISDGKIIQTQKILYLK